MSIATSLADLKDAQLPSWLSTFQPYWDGPDATINDSSGNGFIDLGNQRFVASGGIWSVQDGTISDSGGNSSFSASDRWLTDLGGTVTLDYDVCTLTGNWVVQPTGSIGVSDPTFGGSNGVSISGDAITITQLNAGPGLQTIFGQNTITSQGDAGIFQMQWTSGTPVGTNPGIWYDMGGLNGYLYTSAGWKQIATV